MATQLDDNDILTLTEIGYASVMYGTGDDVEPIFEVLTLLYPDNSAGAIGYAITHMNRGNFDGAIDILNSCISQCTDNTDEAKAILMLALFLSGRNEEAEQLAATTGGSESGIVNTMASSLFNS